MELSEQVWQNTPPQLRQWCCWERGEGGGGWRKGRGRDEEQGQIEGVRGQTEVSEGGRWVGGRGREGRKGGWDADEREEEQGWIKGGRGGEGGLR